MVTMPDIFFKPALKQACAIETSKLDQQGPHEKLNNDCAVQ